MSEQDRIVGELLQPGGLRALERLGLDDCAKDGIDSVPVEGYVVLTTGKEPQKIVLNYPARDPQTFTEYFGVFDGPAHEREEASEGPAGSVPKGRGFHNGR